MKRHFAMKNHRDFTDKSSDFNRFHRLRKIES